MPLLAVIKENVGQFIQRPVVHNLGRRQLQMRAEAHVERAFGLKGETPRRVGQLQRRKPQIKQNAIDWRKAFGLSLHFNIRREPDDGPRPERRQRLARHG